MGSGAQCLLTCATCLLIVACTAGRLIQFAYIGCYFDTDCSRDLTGLSGISRLGKYEVTPGYGFANAPTGTSGITVEMCASICSLGGFSYFGLQAGTGCYCGNQYGRNGKANETDCRMKCSGDSKFCGDSGKNSIYSLMYPGNCQRFSQAAIANLTTKIGYTLPTYWNKSGNSAVDCAFRCNSSCQGFIFSKESSLCYLLRFALVPEVLTATAGDFYVRS